MYVCMYVCYYGFISQGMSYLELVSAVARNLGTVLIWIVHNKINISLT